MYEFRSGRRENFSSRVYEISTQLLSPDYFRTTRTAVLCNVCPILGIEGFILPLSPLQTRLYRVLLGRALTQAPDTTRSSGLIFSTRYHSGIWYGLDGMYGMEYGTQ